MGSSQPFSDSAWTSPSWDGSSAPAPVPFLGFLNLSTASSESKFAALLRAAAAPGLFFPSELSPDEDREPLSRPPAPLRLSTDVQSRRRLNLIAARFRDARALQRSCQLPPTTMGSLSARPKSCFPIPLDSSHGTDPFRQLHPLRSVPPPASPTPPTRSFPRLNGRSSLGLQRLSRVFSVRALDPSTR